MKKEGHSQRLCPFLMQLEIVRKVSEISDVFFGMMKKIDWGRENEMSVLWKRNGER